MSPAQRPSSVEAPLPDATAEAAPRNLLTVWATLLLDALAAAGVRHVVASPGSRSTPYLLAAIGQPLLQVHTIVDERSAGFFALGISRATGSPPVLLCTSGTAAAHYFPAVIEASEAALPLVVLSADRPLDLVHNRAPQTTEQRQLYGGHARSFDDLGEPDGSAEALRGLVDRVIRAVETALGPVPGPVQLNARARKPLEPRAAETEAERVLDQRAQAARGLFRPARTNLITHEAGALERRLRPIRDALSRARKPVLFAGPLPATTEIEPILEFAAHTGLTLLAEASSQLRLGPRACPTADAFADWLPLEPPDLVLEIGATPTCGAYLRWLAGAPEVPRFVLGGTLYRDVSGTADAVVLGPLADLLSAVRAERSHLDSAASSTDTSAVTFADTSTEAFARAERDAWARIERVLDRTPTFSEATAVRATLAALPDHSWLALGNSLPIRHVDRFVRGGGRPLRVLTQRGVNGIDGTLAASAGACDVTQTPLTVLLGDVSFMHDVGSLAVVATVATPLVIVVLDNGGGRIFEQLPIARSGVPMQPFVTPTALDIGLAAQAFGIRAHDVHDAAALAAAVTSAHGRRAATVIRAIVPPHSAAQLAAELDAELTTESELAR